MKPCKCHLIPLWFVVTIAHQGGAVLHEATPVPHHQSAEGASQTGGNTVAVITPTVAPAGVADMSEAEKERGREERLGAGTPSQNTHHPQVEVGDR